MNMTEADTPITIDASGKTIGRIASEAAAVLQGKRTTRYRRHNDVKTYVRVEHLRGARFTGKKYERKSYRWHTGYIGHLKTATLKSLWEKDPQRVFRKMVAGMLPKNKLRARRLSRLSISL